MVKDIMASGKLTTNDLMLFSIYHNYNAIGGKLTGVFGAVSLVLSPIFFVLGDSIMGLVFALVALMYVVITPLGFYSRSKRQITSKPVFKNKMTYIFSKDKVQAIMYTGSSEVTWDALHKVQVTKTHFFLYLKKDQALVVPKRFFACLDDVELFEAFVMDEGLDIEMKKRYAAFDEVDEVITSTEEAQEEIQEEPKEAVKNDEVI